MMKLKLLLAVSGVLSVGCLPATAKDVFVSTSGTWIPEGKTEGACFTDLVEALKTAGSGDTVWVEGGYVCEPADADDFVYLHGDSGHGKAHFGLDNGITLRSESGDARTDANPPVLRGRLHDPATGVGVGDNAIRPGFGNGRVLGFVIENGGCIDSPIYGGGAWYGGTLEKCVVRNSYGPRGVIFGSRVVGCTVTNNTAKAIGTLYGCDVYDSFIAYNRANDGGGVAYNGNLSPDSPLVISNCVIIGNTATGAGGGCSFGSTSYKSYVRMMDSVVTNNVALNGDAGGFSGYGVVTNCLIADNRAFSNDNDAKGAGVFAAGNLGTLQVIDCKIYGNRGVCNRATIDPTGGQADGGGAYRCVLVDCVITNNYAQGCGGGAAYSSLLRCLVADNVSTNRPGYTHYNNGGYGGGIHSSFATNCVIANNRLWHTYGYRAYGGGAYKSTLVNCVVTNNYAQKYGGGVSGEGTCWNTLIAGNRSSGGAAVDAFRQSGWAYSDLKLYNCTVAGNTCSGGRGGIYGAQAFNTISWNNGTAKDVFASAEYSCSAALTDAVTYPHCVATDPHLTDECRLARFRPCKDAAAPYGWMTAAEDVRSKDLDGNPRVQGKAPDMGCYESRHVGLSLLVR